MSPRDCLLHYPLFGLLAPSVFDTWTTDGTELVFQTGEIVFEDSSIGTWAYLILDGRVRMLRKTGDGKEIFLGTMGPGEAFGEYALLPPHKNTATCRVSRTARLLRLPLGPLEKVLKTTFPPVYKHLKNWLRLHALLNYLRDRPFLGFMSAPSALRYLDRLRPMVFPPRHTIQSSGLSVDRLFFIDEGHVAVHDPRFKTRTDLGPGACFGERALAGEEVPTVAISATDVRCQVLTYEAFIPAPLGQFSAIHPSLQSYLSDRPSSSFGWVGQREKSDCGVACLTMIAHEKGIATPIESIRPLVKVGVNGATLRDLKRAADQLRLTSQAIHIQFIQLDQVVLPALAHLRNGHYVVIFALRPGSVVLGDPANGVVTISRALFQQSFSGHLMVFPSKAPRA